MLSFLVFAAAPVIGGELTVTVSVATLIAVGYLIWRVSAWETQRANREVLVAQKLEELNTKVDTAKTELRVEIGAVRTDLAEHTKREEDWQRSIDRDLAENQVWRKESEMDRKALHEAIGRKPRPQGA